MSTDTTTPVTAPVEPAAKRKHWFRRHKVWTALIAVFVVGGIGSAFDGGDTTTTVVKPTTAAPVAKPAAAPKPIAPPVPVPPGEAVSRAVVKALGKSNRDITPKTTVVADGVVGHAIQIKFASEDGFTQNLTKRALRRGVLNALEAVHKSASYPYSSVTIKATFSMADQYGNAGEKQVFFGTFSKATIDRINYENVDVTTIERLADSVLIHPAFRNAT